MPEKSGIDAAPCVALPAGPTEGPPAPRRASQPMPPMLPAKGNPVAHSCSTTFHRSAGSYLIKLPVCLCAWKGRACLHRPVADPTRTMPNESNYWGAAAIGERITAWFHSR
jgi:hypothetical protein